MLRLKFKSLVLFVVVLCLFEVILHLFVVILCLFVVVLHPFVVVLGVFVIVLLTSQSFHVLNSCYKPL